MHGKTEYGATNAWPTSEMSKSLSVVEDLQFNQPCLAGFMVGELDGEVEDLQFNQQCLAGFMVGELDGEVEDLQYSDEIHSVNQ
jgi:hypothetical protein